MDTKSSCSKIFYIIFTFLLLCLVVGLACSPGSAPAPSVSSTAMAPASQSQPARGGILRIAELTEATALGFPPLLNVATNNRASGPAVETLLRFDRTMQTTPLLATGYKNDPSTKTITLTLRKGIKFHDGTDFNAEAVKWNLDQCKSEKIAAAQKIKSVDVIDDYTVRVNFTDSDSAFLSNLCGALGSIVSPASFQKNSKEWAINNPVGTGPFQFVSWQKTSRITYKRNDNYWQKEKPYLDGIEFNILTEPSTRIASFQAKEQDIMTQLAAKDVPILENQGYSIIRTMSGSGCFSIIFDSANSKSPFADVKVRQAVSHAIDTEKIATSLFGKEAISANQWSWKGTWSYNPAVVGYPYDPAKAKQLLAEAGYSNGIKTKLTFPNNPDVALIFTACGGYLKSVGIEAELQQVPFQAHLQNAIGGTWEGGIFSQAAGDPVITTQIAQRFSGTTPWFKQMYVPDDYRQAIMNSLSAADFETTQKYVHEVMKLMVDKYCLQNMTIKQYESSACQKYIHNHGINDTANSGAWTPEDAWLEKK
jgi:peptide/nickel transport system substrate-binding protein